VLRWRAWPVGWSYTGRMENDFTFQLIKGKIAEITFDQMFREAEEFTIIPFGYESTVRELAQYARKVEHKEVMDAVRNAPDFALISHNQKQVFLVEVKYRTRLQIEHVVDIAQKSYDRWKLAWLFVATPDGFYFDSCSNVLHKGAIDRLNTSWISAGLQSKYLEIMNRFKVSP
jgi:hypothetical protein